MTRFFALLFLVFRSPSFAAITVTAINVEGVVEVESTLQIASVIFAPLAFWRRRP